MKKIISLKGVSLLEMVLVLVIMATGAALAIPQLQKGAAQRRADSAIETLRTISHCVRMYKLDHHGALPTSLSDMDDSVHSDGSEGNHCLDPDYFDRNYWPRPIDTDVPLGNYLNARNAGDNRTVCITPLGSTDANNPGYIYDIIGTGTCASPPTTYLRKIKE